jgi:hypothetical protein
MAVKGIVLAALLLVMGTAIYMMYRVFQRELAKLQALIVKGERFHEGIADEPDTGTR